METRLAIKPAEGIFVEAVRQYLARPSKKKLPSFIRRCLDGDFSVTAEAVQAELLDIEHASNQKPAKRIFRSVFNALSDYDAVCFQRHTRVLDRVEIHLRKLSRELQRLAEYEALFPESQLMQDMLVEHYLLILQFWTLVEETYSSSALALAAKSITSASSKRIDEITERICQSSNDILQTVQIVQERVRRGEKEDVMREYKEVERVLGDIFRFQLDKEKDWRRDKVDEWLRDKEVRNNINNFRHQRDGEDVLRPIPRSGEWMVNHPTFNAWMDPSGKRNTIWVHGDPGVGKSVVCARAVNEVQQRDSNALVAFQYYSFDEDSDDPTATYRNIASQLCSAMIEFDDISDSLVDLTRSADDEGAVRLFIERIISESRVTYIFIDGLDEECHEKSWPVACRTLRFLKELADRPDSGLKLWLSSQDRQVIRDEMEDVPEIHINEEANKDDISMLFQHALATRLSKRLSAMDKTAVILQDLQSQVQGNFLWASLMLKTINKAYNLRDLREKSREALPKDFGLYLEKLIQGLEKSPLVIKALSLLTYALRPLTLDELCEALEISDTAAGQNLDDEGYIARESILQDLAPLVRVTKFSELNRDEEVCTLCHGSVRQFLKKNPKILTSKDDRWSEEVEIGPKLLAQICLKYLQQPRYVGQLKRTADGALTTQCGQSVLEHHFLNYSARYWDQHLNELTFSEDLGNKVEKFIRSSSFVTSLQVQTLFLRGKSILMTIRGPEDRMYFPFPNWFIEKQPNGRLLKEQYGRAIDEWGGFLDCWASVKDAFAGQLDQCHWSGLGKSNFLRSIPSSVKCYPLEIEEAPSGNVPTVLFNYVRPWRKEILVFKANLCDINAHQIAVMCDSWVYRGEHQPRLESAQTILIPASWIDSYSIPTIRDPSFRPPLITMSENGTLLRIGSRLYSKTQGYQFRPLDVDADAMEYADEISCGSGVMAIASRRQVWSEAVKSEDTHADAPNHRFQTEAGGPQLDDAASHPISGTNEDDDTCSGVESNFDEHLAEFEELIGLESEPDLRSDLNSFLSCSARESWSESSSQAAQDEIEDDVLWNDWDGVMDLTELEFDYEGLEDKIITHFLVRDPGNDDLEAANDSTGKAALKKRKNELEQLLGIKDDKRSKGRLSEIRIFSTTGHGAYERVFHFVQKARGMLLDSPPVFHPSAKLLVWPIDGGEVLFADYEQGTYFTRTLSGVEPDCCPISVQAKFSSCGKHLHLASFFRSFCVPGCRCAGGKKDKEDGPSKPFAHSIIRITTYQLSENKVTRSPPRLIYRNELDLDNLLEKKEELHGPWPTFTLAWTADYLYVANNKPQLQVYRVPLFQHVEEGTVELNAKHGICENESSASLPSSVRSRSVFFWPSSPAGLADATPGNSRPSNSASGDKNIAATIVLSSRIAEAGAFGPSAGTGRDENGNLPQVIHLTASQFGTFTSTGLYCIHGHKCLQLTAPFVGGQLLSRFEDYLACIKCGRSLLAATY
ncbi:hypothetical protein GQ53DRAFT_841147 [Thozetella sp. PMI_491]|nr:hypothetical protein GQ53DRAFT_841147 [Thozetella sp. PMI_491]